jgi:fructoselysine 6-phosphate deglycase
VFAPFDRQRFLGTLDEAAGKIDAAERLGAELAARHFRRLFLVGCGAPHAAAAIPAYWAHKFTTQVEVRCIFSAELIQQKPAALDERTVVVLASHSGTTEETVEAARLLSQYQCATVGITRAEASPLAQAVQHPLTYGTDDQGYYAYTILLLALTSSFLAHADSWPLHTELMDALPALPAALADAIEASEARAASEAQDHADDPVLYVVAAGPMFPTAYVFAVCFLMEMQWMHAHALHAADFFHGPFEVVDTSTPVLVLLGEDPARPEAERVVRFCQRTTQQLVVYDSRQFEMRGIDPVIRPILAPFIVDAALTRLAAHLARERNHPLSTRRYMGRMEY